MHVYLYMSQIHSIVDIHNQAYLLIKKKTATKT